MKQAHDPHTEHYVQQGSPAWNESVRKVVAAELEAVVTMLEARLAPLLARIVAEQLALSRRPKSSRRKNLLPFNERTPA